MSLKIDISSEEYAAAGQRANAEKILDELNMLST